MTGSFPVALPWLLVALLGAVLCLLWLRTNRVQVEEGKSSKPEDPVLQRFWTGVFTPGSATLMVTPDSGLGMYENFQAHASI